MMKKGEDKNQTQILSLLCLHSFIFLPHYPKRERTKAGLGFQHVPPKPFHPWLAPNSRDLETCEPGVAPSPAGSEGHLNAAAK